MSNLEDLAEAFAFAHEPNSQLPLDSISVEEKQFEQIAALTAFAFTDSEPPPQGLASRLAADAFAFCAQTEAKTPAALASTTSTRTKELAGFITPRSGRTGHVTSFLLGALAAGALLWVALTDSHQQSLTDLRAQALANNPTLQRLDWQPGPSPMRGDVTGDVVWDQSGQSGWLTFRNLPTLAAGKAYQLWIVDENREGAPVDGGVFQIAATDRETVVPVHARLPIGKPAAFVITVEGKEGVVVSKQEHVIAIASL